MAGLLEKDIRLLWGTKQTLVILFAIAVAVAFSGNGNFIIGYLPFVVEMIAISTIAYDEMDHGYQFLLTLPINKKNLCKRKVSALCRRSSGSLGNCSLPVSGVKSGAWYTDCCGRRYADSRSDFANHSFDQFFHDSGAD